MLQDAMGYPLNYSRHVWCWRNRLLRYILLTTGTTTTLPPPRPSTLMTDSLLGSLINIAFEKGIVAESWAESLVVSIPKKGDLANMNNYQGILLIMATVLKSGVCDPQHLSLSQP